MDRENSDRQQRLFVDGNAPADMGVWAFAKEVAKYFMDFLETDFHRRKTPRRSLKFSNESGLKVGINLKRYRLFSESVWKSVKRGFQDEAPTVVKKGQHRHAIPEVTVKVIRQHIDQISDERTSGLVSNIADESKACAVRNRADPDAALAEAADTCMSTIRASLVEPLVDERLAEGLRKLNAGDEGTVYLLKEDLTAVLSGLVHPAIQEIIPKFILDDNFDPSAILLEHFAGKDVRAHLNAFFQFFQVGDLFLELLELEKNQRILDKQELYLNLCTISWENEQYPIFYIPFEMTVEGDQVSIEYDSRLYINKKAIAYIVQEFNRLTGKVGTLEKISSRIVYLAQCESLPAFLNSLLQEIINFFALSGGVNVSSAEEQSARGQHVRLTNGCYISLFDKSDEALINDYEDILQQLGLQKGVIAESFTELIRGFIFDNPQSFVRGVDTEWRALGTPDKLVCESPIPLNEEQRQILAAVGKEGCRFITVQGPPGTGKSHTITAIVCNAVLKGQSVLVLSDKKEALDVVEQKITATMNKARPDTDFQNPILRLGRTGSKYAKILSAPSMAKIKKNCTAVQSQGLKLEQNISTLQETLKSGLQAEAEAYSGVSIQEIGEHTALEEFCDDLASYVDIEELSAAPDSAEDIDSFRQLLIQAKELLFETDGTDEFLQDILGFSTADIASFGNLSFAMERLSSLKAIETSLALEHPGTVDILACLGPIGDEDLATLSVLLAEYRALGYGFITRFFRRGAIRSLNSRFLDAFPGCTFSQPHTEVADLEHALHALLAVRADEDERRAQLEYSCDLLAAVVLVHSSAEAKAMMERFTDLSDLVERVFAFVSKYPSTCTKCGLDLNDPLCLSDNALVCMDDDTFDAFLRLICLRQKIQQAFDSVPDSRYADLKKGLEGLMTVKMRHVMDSAVVDFWESEKGTAKALGGIIRRKERFPKEEFWSLSRAFPCILAGIRDYAEYVPLEPNLFDLVIIDEASQVSVAQAFPALLRARKVLILGDKKQFCNVKAAQARTATNQEYQNRLQGAFKRQVSVGQLHLEKCRHFNIKHSILDFFGFITNFDTMLLKHFRCYKEIIGYSKERFYEGLLQVLKIRGKPIDEVIRFTILDPHDPDIGSGNVNAAEADAIIRELDSLRQRDFKGSIGVITPHTNQQSFISAKIAALPEGENYRKACNLKVWTFDTCQGEERDIVFYSMVATRKHDRLYGVFPSRLQEGEDDEGKLRVQRLNVGFSRAKECIHIVVSKPIEEFRGAIRDALQHYCTALECAKAEPLPDSVDSASPMEREVLNWLTQTDFYQSNVGSGSVMLETQFPMGEYLKQLDPMYDHPNYRVDFLLTYRQADATEHRIIIEYDGFKEHFDANPDVNQFNYWSYYSEDDLYREKVIESYGYKFVRINKFNAGNDPIATLDDRLKRIVSASSEGQEFLGQLQKAVNGLGDGSMRQCPRCGDIKPLGDFRDPNLQTGSGRICMKCKSRHGYRAVADPHPIKDGIPECHGKPMALRNGRYGPFYGCREYPRCKNTAPCRRL